MDDQRSPTTSSDAWSQDCAALGDGRTRRDFLAQQRTRLDSLEAELARQIQTIAEEIAADKAMTAEQSHAIEQRAATISGQAASVAQLKEEQEHRQAAWEKLQAEAARKQQTLQASLDERRHELDERDTQLVKAEATLRQSQRAIAVGQEELSSDREQLQRAQERLKEQRRQLEADRDSLTADQAHTDEQRRRIARQFQAQRAAHWAELEERRAEIATASTDAQLKLEEQLSEATQESSAQREQWRSFANCSTPAPAS